MRWMVVAVLLVGCGDDGPVSRGDAGAFPDARPGRGPDAACEPLTTPFEGRYDIEWACVSGCETDAPFVYFETLDITGASAVYDYDDCGAGCQVEDTLSVDGECFTGNGIPLGNGLKSEPYTVCLDKCEAVGNVSFTGYPGPMDLERVWAMRLTKH